MTARLRIIAGPNGSGKSSLAQILQQQYAVNLYQFINSDVLYKEIAQNYKTPCPFTIPPEDLSKFVQDSTYPDVYKQPFLNNEIQITPDDYISFTPQGINSYTAAITADFIKAQYVANKLSFSFETVFSHPSKIEPVIARTCILSQHPRRTSI